MTAVLAVEAYSLQFGPIRALDDVSLAVAPGEVLGLVGESGSGKTSLAYAIMRHIPRGARESGGAIRWPGRICARCRRPRSGASGGHASAWCSRTRTPRSTPR